MSDVLVDAQQLLAALDAAHADAQRTKLLAVAPPTVREQLNAFLLYHKSHAEVDAEIAAERAAFDAFSRELDAAPDDAARLQVIEVTRADPQRGPSWTAEWSWQRTATSDDWRRRYLAMLDDDTSAL